jgi:F-type H+-transporting ATPase subunit a
MNHLTLLLAENNPLDKAVNYVGWEGSTYNGWWIWSAHIGVMFLTGLIMLLFIPRAAAGIRTGDASMGTRAYMPRGNFAHVIEVICVYLRNEVVEPQLHGRTDRFMPFLWTLFFFILIMNLLGLVPIAQLIWVGEGLFNLITTGSFKMSMYKAHYLPVGGTATGNLWVTGTLAIIAAVVFNIAAIKELGISGFFKHMTGGAPAGVNLIVFLIEFLGQFLIKPFALMVRLFANMTAGGLIIGTLVVFANMAFEALAFTGPDKTEMSAGGAAAATAITLGSVLAAAALTLLKLFVGFLQAFVFMFLVTIFIGLMSHHGDEHDHHDEHGHEHGHSHAHA